MYYIPLRPVPSQKVLVNIGGKMVTILIRQLAGRQYFSMSADGVVYVESSLMVDRVPLIRARYLGFGGDFMSVDTQGTDNPSFTGWGSRYFLLYDNE